MIRTPLYRARDVNEHKYLGPCVAYLVANLLPSFGRRHPLKRLAAESARKVHVLKLLVPSIDVYLWYNRVSALLKLDIISEHAPSSIVKSDLRRAVESARPVQKGLGRQRGHGRRRVLGFEGSWKMRTDAPTGPSPVSLNNFKK